MQQRSILSDTNSRSHRREAQQRLAMYLMTMPRQGTSRALATELQEQRKCPRASIPPKAADFHAALVETFWPGNPDHAGGQAVRLSPVQNIHGIDQTEVRLASPADLDALLLTMKSKSLFSDQINRRS